MWMDPDAGVAVAAVCHQTVIELPADALGKRMHHSVSDGNARQFTPGLGERGLRL